ncbi:hypothetical protein FACS1894126_4460 [Alphaproteobacteria bacterium]|nr:hypothetical protein FACS1894126_4460 [Alphaproteobacteria bacterium]
MMHFISERAVQVDSQREINGKISEESRYYIASRNESAKKTLAKIRSHWAIENSLHWRLDMSFGEDQAKIRKGNAPQNMAIVRHLALNLLTMAKTNSVHYKIVSIKKFRKMAGWNDSVLADVLAQNFS